MATYDVKEAFRIVASMLIGKFGGLSSHVFQPAPLHQVLSVAQQVNCIFPSDLIDLLQATDGTVFCPVFPPPSGVSLAHSVHTLDELRESWRMQVSLRDIEPTMYSADDGVRPVRWDDKWIPFASDGGGDYMCVDMNPVNQGCSGQVIFVSHESSRITLVADSVRQCLNDVICRIREGKLAVNDQYGIVSSTPRENESFAHAAPDLAGVVERSLAFFQRKEYRRFVSILDKYESFLDKQLLAKLHFARKQISKPELDS